MKKVTNLQWSERLALLERFKPADSDAARIFGVSEAELRTARDLESNGTIAKAAIDPNEYAELFSIPSIKTISDKTAPTGITAVPAKTLPPQTATKKKTEPKKRGRKGSAIATAFLAVPAEPVSVEEFAKEHGVSVAVLRQSKRFDTSELDGAVRVRKDKATGVLQIWRETEVASS